MSDISPFDETPARRPTVQDLGGAQKIDGSPKGDAVTMIIAKDANEWGLVGAGVATVCPFLILAIGQTAGTYSISTMRTAGFTRVVGDVTVTKNGTGDVTYSWTAGKFPGVVTASVSLQDGAGGWRTPRITWTSNSVRVQLYDGGGAAVDGNHSVFIY